MACPRGGMATRPFEAAGPLREQRGARPVDPCRFSILSRCRSGCRRIRTDFRQEGRAATVPAQASPPCRWGRRGARRETSRTAPRCRVGLSTVGLRVDVGVEGRRAPTAVGEACRDVEPWPDFNQETGFLASFPTGPAGDILGRRGYPSLIESAVGQSGVRPVPSTSTRPSGPLERRRRWPDRSANRSTRLLGASTGPAHAGGHPGPRVRPRPGKWRTRSIP